MSTYISEKIQEIRNDFPLLRRENPIIYLDNACATLKPESVILAMDQYNREFPTCGGRSMNRLGERVTKAVENVRKTVADFINAKSEAEIIFVRNTTEGINMIARTLDLNPGDVVLTSDKEHNSNLVPWQLLSQHIGVEHRVCRTNVDGTFDFDAYKKALSVGNVKLVAIGHVSNLDGVSIPVKSVIDEAHHFGALVMLDAAQSVPHDKIDVQDLNVDMLVFSGHKMCGPSGTGVVYVKKNIFSRMKPFIVGGSTVAKTTYDSFEILSAPAAYEGGTQDYAGIIGLGEAVRYVEKVGIENISEYVNELNHYATSQILELTDIKILGPDASKRSGILSFFIEGVDIHQVAIALDSGKNVMVRSGQHCVHSWFNDRKILGSVRLSFYFYNNMSDVDDCIAGLKQIIAVYK